MNFVEDVLEVYPSSKPALVAISRSGERRVWHFGELIARSAGVSGAFAARGIERGDVVMTLVGNRVEWVLSLLACWRMGAVALPCNTQLRRKDLELRIAAAGPKLCVGESDLLSEMPAGIETIDMDAFDRILDEESPQEAPAEPGSPRSRGSRPDRLHLRNHGRAARRRCTRPAISPVSGRRPRTGWGHARATSSGARPQRGGRSRPETFSSLLG